MERPSPVEPSPPVGFRREALEAAEDARRVLGRQAGAVVGDCTDEFRALRASFVTADPDRNRPAHGAVLDRVRDEVVERFP